MATVVQAEMARIDRGVGTGEMAYRDALPPSFAPPPPNPAGTLQKGVSASIGAVLSSSIMTPFDVIKTRLQAQAAPDLLFRPSSHLPPVAAPTLEDNLGRAGSTSSSGQSGHRARGHGGSPRGASQLHTSSLGRNTHLATCCQVTYFNHNKAGSLLQCRFDPLEPFSKKNRATDGPSAKAFYTPARTSTLKDVSTPGEICEFPDVKTAKASLHARGSEMRLNGFVDGVVKIVKYEGWTSLWRGLSPALVMAVPASAIYILGYDALRDLMWQKYPPYAAATSFTGPSNPCIPPDSHEERLANARFQEIWAPLFAGGTARMVAATVISPLELFRTRLQASSSTNANFKWVLDGIKTMVKEQGVLSLWRGIGPTLWRDIPFSSIYWAGYEASKRRLFARQGLRGDGRDGTKRQQFAVSFAGGASSGMLAAILTNPFDVAKTRRQAQVDAFGGGRKDAVSRAPSTLSVLGRIMKDEGVPGLCRGLVPRTLKIAPACAIMISSYEIGVRLFDAIEKEP